MRMKNKNEYGSPHRPPLGDWGAPFSFFILILDSHVQAFGAKPRGLNNQVQINRATRNTKGGSTGGRKIDETSCDRGGGLDDGGRSRRAPAERPVHRRGRHEQRPRLLRPSA